MKIILAGGGTGGHLYPGIAIAQEFKIQRSDVEILFLITRRRIDQEIVVKEGWPYQQIAVESMRGLSCRTVRAIYSFFLSIWQAFRVVRSYRPDFIIGLGAYPSVPTMIAGKLAGVRLAIHEQNIFPGGANKILARWADRIFVSFPETREYFMPELREKIIVTGNPVRQGFSKNKNEKDKDLRQLRAGLALQEGKFVLLIFGGSKGARRINEAVMEMVAEFYGQMADRLQIIHQSGYEDYPKLEEFYKKFAGKVRAKVLPFIQKMMEAYSLADMVICRAGATTLAEITVLGKASILIPYPYAVKDHQTVNAASLQRLGAAEMIPNQELTGHRLWGKIQELLDDPEKLARMREEVKKLGKPDASARIVRESLKIVGSG